MKLKEKPNMKPKRFIKIKTKLIIALVISAWSVLFLVGNIIIFYTGKQTSHLMDMNISGQTEAVRVHIDDNLTGIGSALKVAANMKDVQGYLRSNSPSNRANTLNFFKDAIETMPERTVDMYSVSKDKKTVFGTDGKDEPLDESFYNTEWWADVAGKDISVSNPHKEMKTGQMVLTLAVKSTDSGAVCVDIPLANLTSLVDSKKVGKEGYAILVDDAGFIISDKSKNNIGKNIKDTKYSEEFQTNAVGNEPVYGFEYTLDGQKMHAAVEPMKNVDWHILGTVSDKEYDEQLHTVRKVVFGYFFTGIGVITVLIALCITYIVKPINKLQGITKSLADGELDVDVSINTNDETRVLADNISALVDRLKMYIVYIDEISGALEQIGNRNLVFDLHQDYSGEFMKLKEGLLHIQSSLTDAIGSFLKTAESAALGSDNMAAGAQALAQGTTEQASTVEELAASIESMNQRTKEDTNKANQTSQNIKIVEKSIENSNNDMQRMVNSMNKIDEKSKEISKIVDAVEDLAFQTNILSLNASIEAAHVGQAGKGFAVVASEVGNLANKSSKNAKMIAQMIEESTEAVQEGVSITKETAVSLETATKQLLDVIAAIDGILGSYIQNANDLQQFSTGISQISAVVQTNSATSEESAATAEELAGQVNEMRQLISTFHLENKQEILQPKQNKQITSYYHKFNDNSKKY